MICFSRACLKRVIGVYRPQHATTGIHTKANIGESTGIKGNCGLKKQTMENIGEESNQ